MLLIVARHCQTQLNAENRIQGGKSDYDLTNFGKEQANFLKYVVHKELGFHKIDKVYCSDRKRAMHTAEIVAPESKIEVDNRLTAYDLGTAEGIKFEELKSIKRYPLPIIYKKKENLISYVRRVKTALSDIAKANKGKVVLLVTHEDVSAVIDKYMTGKSILSVPSLGLKNGEFRTYHLLSYDEKLIKKSRYQELGVITHKYDNQATEKAIIDTNKAKTVAYDFAKSPELEKEYNS